MTTPKPFSSTNIDDVVISIINFRTPQLSIDCVTSVLNDLDASPAVQAHVVVVDNASGDGSEAVLADWIAATAVSDRVTLICSTNNGGFSSGHNQALRARRARYYLLLNSDAVVRPGFFDALIETATFADNTGLVAPRLEYDNGELQTNCFRILSPVSELIRGAQTGIVTKALSNENRIRGRGRTPGNQLGRSVLRRCAADGWWPLGYVEFDCETCKQGHITTPCATCAGSVMMCD